ncbi:small acid-soluble spore protein P [Paenibacillus swuensis]|uniref:small acid-soluble spore protein P n=1 Tax=Paenibacillus swuensis TaxID=1178515 RepID=UPI000A9D9CA2|nr:small acid-soluble spore protein P [Paenibacillus swuensis]
MKPKVQSVTSPEEKRQQNSRDDHEDHRPEAAAGSKTVKNRNHSRHNHAEGS